MYKETLIDDLQKYGDLKLAIKNLEDIEKDLKSRKKDTRQTNKEKTKAQCIRPKENNLLFE